jgi:hypothetical protein
MKRTSESLLLVRAGAAPSLVAEDLRLAPTLPRISAVLRPSSSRLLVLSVIGLPSNTLRKQLPE